MDDYFTEDISDHDMVVQWFNSAAISQSCSEKVEFILKIQEILLHKSPHLLNQFLVNMLNFTTDKNPDVKKTVVTFIEEACKMDESTLIKVMLNLQILLTDKSIPVQKRVIQGAITIYKRMLSWLCKAPNVNKEMEDAWIQLNAIKTEITGMIDSDNDGIRTSCVKFLECVVLLQSYPDGNTNKVSSDFSLEDVPLTLKVARRRKLEEEANNVFAILLKFHGSPHISSANLFACIGVLTNIGKNRPQFMSDVIKAIENLHSNLPPTLSTTQVNSVRKKLKSELSGLIKHPAANDFIDTIHSILLDLGYSHQDIVRLVPKIDERRKCFKRFLQTDQHSNKRVRLDDEYDSTGEDEDVRNKRMAALEANEKQILENLNKNVTVQMVINSLYNVPDTMPIHFVRDYEEVLTGKDWTVSNRIAKLLAVHFLEAGVGPGYLIAGKMSAKPDRKNDDDIRDLDDVKDEDQKGYRKDRIKVPRIKTLKLGEITKPLDKGTKKNLMLGSVRRILEAYKNGDTGVRQKILITIASTFNEAVRENILTFVLYDLRTHLDLALAWLYEEYSIMQGFTRLPDLRRNSRLDQNYNSLLNSFVTTSSSDIIVLSRLLLEAPIVTEQVCDQLCIICRDEHRCNWSMGLLRDLIIRRPTRQKLFLNALLSHTTYESNVIRDCAIGHVLDLYRQDDLKLLIDEYVNKNLEHLKQLQPPDKFFGHSQGRLEGEDSWSDDLVKACLQPYMYLIPHNPKLIHNLANVYIQTNADIKRVILRLLESPIRGMGMESVELLKLVEECPKGSETLVTRVIHILTDKGTPSVQLVNRVRDLYNTRVYDVRFLIPVLNGLTKKEIIAALPKLIKLNPVVVREVFNRLLGVHGESNITPTELLVALHTLDNTKADLKTVMKATSMCLSEKQIFTQEVLAVVLQQLMDQPTLPTLLMRTVIQALGSYPRLSGFVMNILQRLILKQVWKHKVVWEGFIKCCQRTKPQSFAVLMQLPVPQLIEALQICPELLVSLKDHLMSFTDVQRAHIPAAVQDAILGTTLQQTEPSVQSSIQMEILPSSTSTLEPLPPGMD